MRHRVTKTWGHEHGLSCAFRQWRAGHSHCSLVHGYALAVAITFEADHLDERGWVLDFGALAAVKKILVDLFDHKTVIAEDDPHLDTFKLLADIKLVELVVLPNVGCENFAAHVSHLVTGWLDRQGLADRVRVAQVDVSEHGANKATVIP
jgi:6-pyruvoyltetrahydropterin/6-carboxytetrahydropterin synthase